MSAEWYKEQPTNRNFLNPIGYLLKLEKFEGVDFSVRQQISPTFQCQLRK